MHNKVMVVDEVNAILTKSFPPQLVMHAGGRVPTTGWSHGQLVPATYLVEPADGIWDFDFVAESPDGKALQLISPISASVAGLPLPEWCVGVRVHAASNVVEHRLFEGMEARDEDLVEVDTLTFPAPSGNSPVHRDPGDAWPWVVSPAALRQARLRTESLQHDIADGETSIEELIGCALRVIRAGEVYSTEYIEDRVNFVMDEDGKIHSLFFG